MRNFLVLLLLVFALFGCSTDNNVDEHFIKVAITGPYYGTYLLDLKGNILEVSQVNTNNKNIKSSRYVSTILEKKEKILTDSELQRIQELANKIYQEKEYSTKKQYLDGTKIDILMNDKKMYSFYKVEIFDKRDSSAVLNDNYKNFLVELIKYSPIDINKYEVFEF